MIKEGYKPTWKNKKLYFMNFPHAVVVFGITLLLIGSTIIIAPVPISVAAPIDSRAIVWDVRLDMSEDLEGTSDYVVFGEAPDANDGPPADSYDQPKPPAPMLPFVRTWFDDGLSSPYNLLSKDYREYNNTNYKEWNLTIHWMPDDASNTDVNVTWDSDEFNDSEYDIVILYDINNNVEVDMILNSYYEFLCPAYVPQDFTINCSIILNQPPVAGFTFEPSDPTTYETIYFNSTSSDPDGSIVNWTWDFDDGSGPVYGENVTHEFTNDGTYDVNLTVKDDDDATDSIEHAVTVGNHPPIAGFTFEPTEPTTSDLIYFNSTSYDPDGTIVSWLWDLGDGNTSTLQNPTHQYTDNGVYIVNLNVTDDDGDTDTYTQTVNVSNEPPVAGFTFEPSDPTTYETIYFNSTSSDPDGSIVNWTWDLDDGNVSYGEFVTHQYEDDGIYTVNLTVTDDDSTTGFSEQTVTVGNQPPVAVNDTTSTPEDTPVVIDVLDNDYDPDGTIDPTIVTVVDDTEHGNTSVNSATGEVTYTPDLDYHGSDNFTYTVDDDDGATSNEATVSITVTDVNDPPVAVNDTATTPEDTTVVIDVLDNDYDPDGTVDPTKVTIVNDVSHGNASVNGTTGEVMYTPDPDYYGSDSFTYTVDDDDGNTSNEATVSITVTDVNDPPVFSNETPTNGTTGVSTSMSPLSVTIEDPDGDSYNWSIQTSPNIGNSFGNGTNNSIISCGISGLSYSTTYTWFVSVTDGKDWTNESYLFTTKAKSGGGGSGSGEENQKPVAEANGPYSGFINEEITFNGSESTDDGAITNYTWNFGDGNTGYDEITTHTYIKAGTYVITLTVTDDGELKNTDETTAEISQPNIPPEMQTVTGPTSGTKDTEYTYNATATDEDNDMIQYYFDWDDGTTNTTAFIPNGTAAIQTHAWTAAGKYTISVQAHDNQTPSDITRYTVLIDTHIVDDIGYITDDDANGTYDTFHDIDLETDLGQDEEGKYLIDSDGDGEWNYVYDPETEELTEYEAEPTPHDEEDYTGIILLGLLIIIIIIIFVYMVMKKKKPEPPKKNKK